MSDHKITVYSCGHVQSQCRCPDPHKTKVSLTYPCPPCAKAALPSLEAIKSAPGTCAECEVIHDPANPGARLVSLCIKHRQPHGDLTPPEFEIHQLLAEAVNRWRKLEYRHPNEMEEVVFFIHGLQRLLMAHSAMRRYPSYFTQPEPKSEEIKT
jgi:hypothetical protein